LVLAVVSVLVFLAFLAFFVFVESVVSCANGAESNAEAEREYEKLFHLCVISLVEFNKMPSPESYRERHE
jgi:hypothetical protein